MRNSIDRMRAAAIAALAAVFWFGTVVIGALGLAFGLAAVAVAFVALRAVLMVRAALPARRAITPR